jgi:hypothetical protein
MLRWLRNLRQNLSRSLTRLLLELRYRNTRNRATFLALIALCANMSFFDLFKGYVVVIDIFVITTITNTLSHQSITLIRLLCFPLEARSTVN